MANEQITFWQGQFGDEYTIRNVSDIDEIYKKDFGITRTELVMEILKGVPKDARILEVGCNRGLQLDNLRKIGFTNLWGIDINKTALKIARKKLSYNVVLGSAFDIPFKDSFFDLVFTSGVLIHIHPDNLEKALTEIYRVSKTFIWGTEYFSNELEQITYRGHDARLWKCNYAKRYKDLFSGIKLLKEKKLKYLDNDNTDIMFLFEK